MKNSAGIFYPTRKQQKFHVIRLNLPMLSLRNDKEVAETLLHEMTHAFLHSTQKRVKPHGKEFQQKIKEINEVLSLNITTTHQYMTWYRCDGICREFESCLFGYVSRVANPTIGEVNSRKHKLTCGGSLKETEKPGKEVLSVISKRYKEIKSIAKRKKKLCNDYERVPFFRQLNPKIIEYSTTDDES